jgi:hypothetical protein
VLVGTSSGLIFMLDTASGVLRPMTVDPAVAASVGQAYQFCFLAGGAAVARFAGVLLRLDPSTNAWAAVPGNGLPKNEAGFFFMAVDFARTPNILYAATDFGVHASWDAAANWLPVGQGLPLRCHPATMRFVAQPDGARLLYLFTYGRSCWRARLK